ncbi:MAG: S26 family signal peptidase [Flavonifractor plautii]
MGRITPVVGESMLPTLHEGDVMLIRDIGYTGPQPGDIVVLTKEFDAARGPIVKDRRRRAVTVDIDYQDRRWFAWTAKPWTSPI